MKQIRDAWGDRPLGLRLLLFIAEEFLFHLEENAHMPNRGSSIRGHSKAVRELVVEAWRAWEQPLVRALLEAQR